MTTDNSKVSSSSRCPVKNSDGSTNNEQSSFFWSSLFNSKKDSSSSSSRSNDQVMNANAKQESLNNESCSSSSLDLCPVINSNNADGNTASLEEAARHAQTPQPDQRIPLGTERETSSIPRGDSGVENQNNIPHHQHSPNEDSNWVYPSEQQLYNAMRKKGWSNIPEESIPTVLQIHNNINERTWKQIQNWEGTKHITLARFQGRPRDVSPKAYIFTSLLHLYDPPFDRHDWYIQQKDNNVLQRYVIDYYYLQSSKNPNMPPIPYVDARPALDHPRAIWLHGKRFLQLAFPGITTYLKQRSNNS